MIETLHQTEFETVFGTFSFDDNGDMTAPGFVWYHWKDGEYVPVIREMSDYGRFLPGNTGISLPRE
jgi:hypothetical protein